MALLLSEKNVLTNENGELYDENKALREMIKDLKKPKQWYPEGHPNFKYTFLNMLPINVMNRDGGEKEMFGRQNMDGLIRQVFDFNATNKADTKYESWTTQLNYHVLKMPIAHDEDDFSRKAKEEKWTEEMLKKAVKDGEVEEGIEYMLEYLINTMERRRRAYYSSLDCHRNK